MEMPYKFIQQGWQCPVCGKVHAPWASECDCHKVTAHGTPSINTDWTHHETTTAPNVPFNEDCELSGLMEKYRGEHDGES